MASAWSLCSGSGSPRLLGALENREVTECPGLASGQVRPGLQCRQWPGSPSCSVSVG